MCDIIDLAYVTPVWPGTKKQQSSVSLLEGNEYLSYFKTQENWTKKDNEHPVFATKTMIEKDIYPYTDFFLYLR